MCLLNRASSISLLNILAKNDEVSYNLLLIFIIIIYGVDVILAQEKLRTKQALLMSGFVTLILTSLSLFIHYEQCRSVVSEGLTGLQNYMLDEFNTNELISDAMGVRYHQIKSMGHCGDLSQFKFRGDVWGINVDVNTMNPSKGGILTKRKDSKVLCLYAAADFISEKRKSVKGNDFHDHRYLISKDSSAIFFFTSKDTIEFHFSPTEGKIKFSDYFYPSVDFYSRLLSENVTNKSARSTNFYNDALTGSRVYSVVSYVYDLSANDKGDHIIGYLLYDHSKNELQSVINNIFDKNIIKALDIALINNVTNESLCIYGECTLIKSDKEKEISKKYSLRYSLHLYRFLINDVHAKIILSLAPFLFIILMCGLRKWLNTGDLKVYIDSLTGCFNRKIFDVMKRKNMAGYVVVLLDCDKFKSLNDTWGHLAGDTALQIIASCMLSNRRTRNDMVIRTGGDEFIILFHGATLGDALGSVERIADQISGSVLNIGDCGVSLSVSWGISEVSGDLDSAIQSADEKMYKMKQKRT